LERFWLERQSVVPLAVWILLIVVGLLAVVAIVVSRILPPRVERAFNKVETPPPYQIPQPARALHARLPVVDLHADPLLWKRDLLKRSDYGHIDVPRLLEWGVALQVFGVVTKVPRGLNFESNSADSDLITPLALAQAWPPHTWRSLLQRALYQASKLERLAARSEGRLTVVRAAGELEELIARIDQSEPRPQLVGGILALEGVHALEGDVANLEVLYDAGFRMIGLTHFFDNPAGGSAHGEGRGGLTPFGRELVRRVEEKRMLLDLAHASPQVIDDVLALATAPVIVSHTGVRGTYDSPRNLSDAHVRGIAATGGVMGMAMFREAVGGAAVADTARAMRYAVDLVGVEHIALGTDFDGAVPVPVDASGLALLTEALIRAGFSEAEIEAIMARNALRVLGERLPP
jgi:membrane dipeptidase